MDKTWIDLPNRMCAEYVNGIDQFLTYAYTNLAEEANINCPCRRCENRFYLSKLVVRDHLISFGFLKKYKNWVNHGESYVSFHGNQENENFLDMDNGDDMIGMIHEAMGIPVVGDDDVNDALPANEPQAGPNDKTAEYFRLLENAQTELYPGCNSFTVLSFIVRLMHTKVLSGWTDKSFTILLELLNEAFPEGVKLAKSYYEARKLTKDLGFTYETWDACPNSCMLFRGEDVKIDKCVICNSSRWKQNACTSNEVDGDGKRIAVKQMRYFPLRPRLQRLFMSSKTAKFMRWHAEERLNDGILRHPADSLAWIIYLESERGHHVDASGQAQDATSVRESVGDGSTPRS
ncbi:uncharacterized protein LOC120002932 [Tripterygium wilfordii]|uniref:uncharacterized protein LOC120002932 n=1 Tax=Tripterygium wilfordii TaxID=458696 RepID=UPI0018F81D50|nr:uncharacterized protein LOC120002932 [Tripterygium wilfordii]